MLLNGSVVIFFDDQLPEITRSGVRLIPYSFRDAHTLFIQNSRPAFYWLEISTEHRLVTMGTQLNRKN